MARRTLNIDLNRVEGDLEFQIDLEDRVIVDARCIGTLYRGFEQILYGRVPTDALVITPRVCGICGTAHLYSAVLALEQLAGIVPSAHAVQVRNLCLLSETLQSDLRQSFLFFVPDLCHERYAEAAEADAIQAAFANLKGTAVRETLDISRKVVGLVALFGGQWPHSSYMLPGGVVTPATAKRLLECCDLVDGALRWFEQSLLGGSLEAWLELADAQAFFAWMEAAQGHIPLFCRFSRAIGLQRLGRGTAHMLSYGLACRPGGEPGRAPDTVWAAGFHDGDSGQVLPLDHTAINEHVRHSWYLPYEGGRHPWQGETIPDLRLGGDRYTWSKAPRYGNHAVQTGPLAELLIQGEPLIQALFALEGDNTWLRQFARLRRAGHVILLMRRLLNDLSCVMSEPHFIDPRVKEFPDGEAYGLVEAARRSLGHWLRVKNGAIDKYQIVTPTAWNASPKDSAGRHGHWEQSVIGLELQNPDDPVEIGHIVRSHDPCLVCTVHFVGSGAKVNVHV